MEKGTSLHPDQSMNQSWKKTNNKKPRGSFGQRVDSIYGDLDKTLENIDLKEGWDSESSKNDSKQGKFDILLDLSQVNNPVFYGEEDEPQRKGVQRRGTEEELAEKRRKEDILNRVGMSIKDMSDMQTKPPVGPESSGQLEKKRVFEKRLVDREKKPAARVPGVGLNILDRFTRKTNKYRLGSAPNGKRSEYGGYGSVRPIGRMANKDEREMSDGEEELKRSGRFRSTPGERKTGEGPTGARFMRQWGLIGDSGITYSKRPGDSTTEQNTRNKNIALGHAGSQNKDEQISQNTMKGQSKEQTEKREKVYQKIGKFLVGKNTQKPNYNRAASPREPSRGNYAIQGNQAYAMPNQEEDRSRSRGIETVTSNINTNRKRSPKVRPRQFLDESSNLITGIPRGRDYKLYKNTKGTHIGSQRMTPQSRRGVSQEKAIFQSQTQNGYMRSPGRIAEAVRMEGSAEQPFSGRFLGSLKAAAKVREEQRERTELRGRGWERDIHQQNYNYNNKHDNQGGLPSRENEMHVKSMPNNQVMGLSRGKLDWKNRSQRETHGETHREYNLDRANLQMKNWREIYSKTQNLEKMVFEQTKPMINVTSNFDLENVLKGARTDIMNWQKLHSRAETRSVPGADFVPFEESEFRNIQTKLMRKIFSKDQVEGKESPNFQDFKNFQSTFNFGENMKGRPRAMSPGVEVYWTKAGGQQMRDGTQPGFGRSPKIRAKSHPLREKPDEVEGVSQWVRNAGYGRQRGDPPNNCKNKNQGRANFEFKNMNLGPGMPVYQFNSGHNIKNNININILMKKNSGTYHEKKSKQSGSTGGRRTRRLGDREQQYSREHLQMKMRGVQSSQTLGNRTGSLVSGNSSLKLARKRPLSRGDLLGHLVDLFRKMLVYSTKIRSLKQKIKLQNSMFSSLPIFCEFSASGGESLNLEDLALLFYNLGFNFSYDFTNKILVYLSRFRMAKTEPQAKKPKLSAVRETNEGTSEHPNVLSNFAREVSPTNPRGHHKTENSISFPEFSRLFDFVSTENAFKTDSPKLEIAKASSGTYIKEMDYHVIRQIIILLNRKLEDLTSIIQFIRSYSTRDVYEVILEYAHQPANELLLERGGMGKGNSSNPTQFTIPDMSNLGSPSETGGMLTPSPTTGPNTGSPKSELFSFMKNFVPSPSRDRQKQFSKEKLLSQGVLSAFLKVNHVQFIESDLNLVIRDLTDQSAITFECFDRFLMSEVWNI